MGREGDGKGDAKRMEREEKVMGRFGSEGRCKKD